MGEFFTVIVGEDLHSRNKAFLVAPDRCCIDVNDEVVSDEGDGFLVEYSKSYVTINSSVYDALFAAFGSPKNVMIHKAVREVDWGGDKDDSSTDTPCGGDCRSGSGDGDGSAVFGE